MCKCSICTRLCHSQWKNASDCIPLLFSTRNQFVQTLQYPNQLRGILEMDKPIIITGDRNVDFSNQNTLSHFMDLKKYSPACSKCNNRLWYLFRLPLYKHDVQRSNFICYIRILLLCPQTNCCLLNIFIKLFCKSNVMYPTIISVSQLSQQLN